MSEREGPAATGDGDLTAKRARALVSHLRDLAGSNGTWPVSDELEQVVETAVRSLAQEVETSTVERATGRVRVLFRRHQEGRIHDSVFEDVVYQHIKALTGFPEQSASSVPPGQYNAAGPRACGRCDEAYPVEEWRRLRFNGVHHSPDHDDCYETRTRACGTTLSWELRCNGSRRPSG